MTARQGVRSGIGWRRRRQQARAEVDTFQRPFSFRGVTADLSLVLECEQKGRGFRWKYLLHYKPCHGTWGEAAMGSQSSSNPPAGAGNSFPRFPNNPHCFLKCILQLLCPYAHFQFRPFHPVSPRIWCQGQMKVSFFTELGAKFDKSVQAASGFLGARPSLCLDAQELPCVGSEVPTAGLMLRLFSPTSLGGPSRLCPPLHLDNDKC